MSDTSGHVSPTNGIAGGYTGDNVNILRAMIAFAAIAWYNCIELTFLIFLRFKKRRGLYFWSLMVTCWSIIVYEIGSWGKMRNIIPGDSIVMTLFTNVGWIFMITGNSLVLYSRLHLLTQNETLLRCVLAGILVNTVCMYVPTTALDFGANVVYPDKPVWVHGYSIMERIQMTMFTVQELLISGIYLLEAYRYLKVTYIGDKRSRSIMYELLFVNVIIIVLDIVLLSVAQESLFQIEVTLKGLVYSIKLKLELGVLSRLVQIVTSGGSGLQRSTTFENDLVNVTSAGQAFTGLDFDTSPLPDEMDPSDRTEKASSDSTLNEGSDGRRNSRRPRPSVPWVTQTDRTRSQQSESPLRPPPIHQLSLHRVQRGESFSNAEFLTSAAVTEGANDDNIREFQREIEAELGNGSGPGHGTSATADQLRHMHRSLPSTDSASVSSPPPEARAITSPAAVRDERAARRRKLSRTDSEVLTHADDEDEDEDEDEEEWARDLGVLGRPPDRRATLGRDDSLARLYPGRITGGEGV